MSSKPSNGVPSSSSAKKNSVSPESLSKEQVREAEANGDAAKNVIPDV